MKTLLVLRNRAFFISRMTSFRGQMGVLVAPSSDGTFHQALAGRKNHVIPHE